MALVHHWPMDENAGGTLHDIVGAFDYVLPGGVIGWAAGYNTHAASFMQKLIGGVCPDVVHAFGVLTECTWSFWSYSDSTQVSLIGIFIDFNDNRQFWWNHDANQKPFNIIWPQVFDEWTHWVWTTKDGDSQNLYKNGVFQVTAAPLVFEGGQWTRCRIGAFTDAANYAPGTMQDLMFYNHALSQAEVTALYNSQVAGASTPALLPSSVCANVSNCTETFSINFALSDTASSVSNVAGSLSGSNGLSGVSNSISTCSASQISSSYDITKGRLYSISGTVNDEDNSEYIILQGLQIEEQGTGANQ